jgi:hypothetical protein
MLGPSAIKIRRHAVRPLIKTTLILTVLAVAALPVSAQTEIPESWTGIWNVTTEVYECETSTLLFSSTEPDTICPGDVFEDPDGGDVTIECTSSVDDTEYTIQCTGSEEIMPGCTMIFTYDGTTTREGDSFTSVATIDITYEGCTGFPDNCQRIESTGTRIAGPPNPCNGTPVEGYSWGTVKALYR